MTLMKKDEMQILKGVSIKVSDDVMLLVTKQYHVEEDPNRPGKKDHSKSRYRWLARAYDIPALKERIKEMNSDAHRLEAWRWPDDPNWDGKILGRDSTQYDAARWLTLKLSKALPWEEGLKVLKGWDKKEKFFRDSLAYPTAGYQATDGSVIDLSDQAAVLSHVNQTFFLDHPLKSQLPN